jgi:tetratricopeptide (TPR) repeat protein
MEIHLLDQQLKAGEIPAALATANQILGRSPDNFAAWLGKAVALMRAGRATEADEAAERARSLCPGEPQALLIQAMLDQRLGRIDRVVEQLVPLVESGSPHSAEAGIILSETLWYAHRRDALSKLVSRGGAWLSDPRAQLTLARLRAIDDPSGAITDLATLASNGNMPLIRRIAGFEAAGLLDKTGRYREAFDLASRVHAQTTPPYNLDAMLAQVRYQAARLARREHWKSSQAQPVEGVVMVVGLPRSGTTLLEQMLDCHPDISGIGEYEGVDVLTSSLMAMRVLPHGLASLSRDVVMNLQGRYLAGARRIQRPGARWLFDKNLRGWRWLPAIATVLPGTVFLRTFRDPRDMAISAFLSHFNPISEGWTGDLTMIRKVAEAERSILPDILDALGAPYESVRYEDLVASPSPHAHRCLSRLGLRMVDQVIHPESNPRAVFTLSHAQVRQPIYQTSVERWKNYRFAFDSSWDSL